MIAGILTSGVAWRQSGPSSSVLCLLLVLVLCLCALLTRFLPSLSRVLTGQSSLFAYPVQYCAILSCPGTRAAAILLVPFRVKDRRREEARKRPVCSPTPRAVDKGGLVWTTISPFSKSGQPPPILNTTNLTTPVILAILSSPLLLRRRGGEIPLITCSSGRCAGLT